MKLNKHLQDLIESHINANRDLIFIEDNIYHNDLFGITFKIPKDWHVISINQYLNLFDQQILVGEFEHYKRKLYRAIDQPSLLISKYDPNSDKYYGLISPVLNFNIIGKNPEYKGMTLKQYAELLDRENPFGYHMLKEFRITNKGDLFNKDGCNSILYETEYLFEHIELDEGVMVEMRVLNIDYGDFFLDFSMTDCRSQGEIASQEFQEIIDSIGLKN